MTSKHCGDWGISGVYKPEKRKTIFHYWSRRYLATLLIGLILIAAGSVWWIKKTTVDHRLNLMHIVGQEMADRIVTTNGRILSGPLFEEILRNRAGELDVSETPAALIVTDQGEILVTNQRGGQIRNAGDYVDESLYQKTESVVSLDRNQRAYVISEPIESGEETLGYVVLVNDKETLSRLNQEYGLLALLLGGVGLLGWGVIYYLTRQLSKPLKETARAARMVSEGSYDIQMSSPPKEKELAELMDSFTDMAAKLKQLEEMRTELLAGVTHDLKTPVTSMSGLIQAVKDDIVEGSEAKEYLDLSLKEMERLQVMIQDLLSFNTYAAGALPMYKKHQMLRPILTHFQKQWQSDPDHIQLDVHFPEEEVALPVDDHRLKQILFNLVQNAGQAVQEGKVMIDVTQDASHLIMNISDNGPGIPEEEQPLIFERFYRGKNKKLKQRGLGLGLPLSRMLAEAHGGKLELTRSSENGTIFTLKLPLHEV
ncbi:sensor histidine kinase [Halobacillus litoralis]|uniref:HAMP domain-containing sensor histidine kinase n=1 Tax=Halobacillus litoralis TaxID=45668 RepID=UPI001CD1AD8D|nr:HAMP domain-containing sensor histidine kinase [Halobacillus litoralis]MCA1023554.1 HAMP domain-containing histidine kinase [Halobacillus litoralis]